MLIVRSWYKSSPQKRKSMRAYVIQCFEVLFKRYACNLWWLIPWRNQDKNEGHYGRSLDANGQVDSNELG